jgi:hypothetical protein
MRESAPLLLAGAAALQRRLDTDGYLLLSGIIDLAKVHGRGAHPCTQ